MFVTIPSLLAPRLLPRGITLNYPIGIRTTNAELSGPNFKLATFHGD